MVSQFSAIFPFGNLQSSAVLLLQVPKMDKRKKNSLTDSLSNAIHLYGRAVIYLFVVFSKYKKNIRISLTTLSLSVVSKQAVGHSDRKCQAIEGHIYFKLRNFHYTIYAWLIDLQAKFLIRQSHSLFIYSHLVNKRKQKRDIHFIWL